MSYRLSGSNPVRLHLTEADAVMLRDLLRVEAGPDGASFAGRLADRLDARLEEVGRHRRRRSEVSYRPFGSRRISGFGH